MPDRSLAVAAQKHAVVNRVGEIRKSRGLGASELARRIGVSRQTIYSIESGEFVPNTQAALRLARELGVPFEALFSLEEESADRPDSLAVEMLSPAPAERGRPVRVCRVGSRWIGVPASALPYYLPEADGILRHAGPRRSRIELAELAETRRLVVAGCDPAAELVARMVQRIAGVEIVSAAASSTLALNWLKEGKVHIAGTHLEDPRTGEFNLPFIHRELPGAELTVVTLASWEEGLVVARGNPLRIRRIEDLARGGIRLVNREPGSGSRALLDRLLASAGVEPPQVAGYDRVVFGHLEAASHVALGEAEVCLATRSAAQAFGLGFVPLHAERYDLVMRRHTAALPAVEAFLDVLQRAGLRRKLEVLAGYDTSKTGAVVG